MQICSTLQRFIQQTVFDFPNPSRSQLNPSFYSCSFALERLSDDGNSPAVPLTRLLVAGGKFMYIRARPGTPLPQGPSFSELAAELSDDELRRALDFEISYGSM